MKKLKIKTSVSFTVRIKIIPRFLLCYSTFDILLFDSVDRFTCHASFVLSLFSCAFDNRRQLFELLGTISQSVLKEDRISMSGESDSLRSIRCDDTRPFETQDDLCPFTICTAAQVYTDLSSLYSNVVVVLNDVVPTTKRWGFFSGFYDEACRAGRSAAASAKTERRKERGWKAKNSLRVSTYS